MVCVDCDQLEDVCTCDDEFTEDCSRCGELFNTEVESKWYAQRVEKMCDSCFEEGVTAEQYDVKEIEKELYE
tara:strand:- start:42 stop:257 length:216 start_codon:yes stop_codon:yes gene_type:complete